MLLLLTLGCMHTPPHPPAPSPWTMDLVRRAEALPDGTGCVWEAENLSYGGAPVWAEPGPEGEGWCEAPGEEARLVDVLGQDGVFLSVRLRTFRCCPEVWEERWLTWNLATGAPATLEQYDERLAERRWARLQRLQARDPTLAGWDLARDRFVVGDGHVRFVALRGGEVRLIPVP